MRPVLFRLCRPKLDRVKATAWTRLKQAMLVVYGLCIRVKVVGRAAVPLRRSFIVVANHLNGADSVVLQVALRTRLFFAASARWFKGPFSRFIMRHICDSFPVETGMPLESVAGVRSCLDTLRSGGSIGMYPEGIFNLTGRVTELKDGAAYMACRTGTPILPVYIRNLRYSGKVDSTTIKTECWTGFLSVVENLFNTRIQLMVGEPIVPSVPSRFDRARLRAEIARINAALRQEFDELAGYRDASAPQ